MTVSEKVDQGWNVDAGDVLRATRSQPRRDAWVLECPAQQHATSEHVEAVSPARSVGDLDQAVHGLGVGVRYAVFEVVEDFVLPVPERGHMTIAQVAALFVETDGAYFGLPGVHPWDERRDARAYAGPHPVVAHPPCQRWGRFWHGSTRKPHQYKLGDDQGCFASALAAVRQWGGVLEHPCDSHAWRHFGLTPPKRHVGWVQAGDGIGWTCYVEQGHYGHDSRKPTWLYAVRVDLPELIWAKGEQRLHPVALQRYGYAKARRIGITAMVGGKHKTRIRNATPPAFRDLLLGIAASAFRS